MGQERRIVRVEIWGMVQGVGFRYWTEREATRRGLEGWVRNLPDGSVEALLAGEPDKVEAMIAACRHGPPGAVVDRLDIFSASEAGLAMRRDRRGFIVLR